MIRYKKLGYVALNVTDVGRAAVFYRDRVGFDLVSAEGSEPALLSCNRDNHNVALYRSGQPGFKRVAFEMEDAEQLERAFERVHQAGCQPTEVAKSECAALRLGRAFRFRDANGIQIELYSGMFFRPTAFAPHPIKLLRLSHVVLRVPRLEESVKFYTDIMNFRISDYRYKPTGEMTFAFMRCFPSPFHHSFGLSQGQDLRFFHAAFSVADIDDMGLGRNRLLAHDVPVVFGPGRHLASGSIFMYFLDPDGLTLEYTLGMEEFSEQAPRAARMLDNSLKTTDMWEGQHDSRIGAVGHVETG